MQNYNMGMLMLVTIIIGILLNLTIPHILLQVATDEEKNVSNKDIGIKGNIMRILVYNSHYPLTSSIFLALIIATSLFLGSFIKIRRVKLQSLNN